MCDVDRELRFSAPIMFLEGSLLFLFLRTLCNDKKPELNFNET